MISLNSLILIKVVYGWSSDVLGFVIERAAKTTLDSYL